MKNLNILVCEGNTPEEGKVFQEAGIKTHTESLKESLSYYNKSLKIDVLNPCLELNLNEIVPKLKKYDGIIWGGSSLNIYSNTPEIRRQLDFMKECQNKIKKILAICWGMQVAVTVAGGDVKKCTKGAHRGIAHNIEINDHGLKHPIYQNKNKIFNTPAFNFDEVVTLPTDATLLASNKINDVMSTNFKAGISNVWGIQYHPEITYNKMISLIHFRKDRLLKNQAFKDEDEIKSHVKIIEEQNKLSNKDQRMTELKNWLDYLNAD